MPDQTPPSRIGEEPNADSFVDAPIQPSGDQHTPSTPASIVTSSNKDQTEQLEKDIRTGERWIIGLGVATIVINTVIALIYYGQLKEMRKATEAATKSANAADATLKEIRQGGTDTHELAVQAKNQADPAKTQSESTKPVALSGVEQAKATNKLAVESSRSADAAVTNSKATQTAVVTGQKNLLLAERVLFVQERPWVGINTFNAIVENGKPITGTITFNNYGRSPAFDVEIITACTFDRSPLFTLESSYLFVPSGSKSIMMPGSGKTTVGLSCDLHLSATQFSPFDQGLKKIYLFGIIQFNATIT